MRTTRTLVFRDDEGDPVLTVSTELQPNPERAALYIETSTSDLAIPLTGEHVEELHEWTSHVLEGRRRPQNVLCGASDGAHRCCLSDGHQSLTWPNGVSVGMHVSNAGVVFQGDVPF